MSIVWVESDGMQRGTSEHGTLRNERMKGDMQRGRNVRTKLPPNEYQGRWRSEYAISSSRYHSCH